MNNQIIRKLIPLFAVVLVQLACELPVPSPSDSSTTDPVSIETIIAGTAAAAQTQTALFLPSFTNTTEFTSTPLRTATPTRTPSPTETIFFIIPTLTKIPTSTKAFELQSVGECKLDALTPSNPVLDPGTKVDIQWTIRNTSSDTWVDTNVDFVHTGGTDMHKTDAYDLPQSVAPNGSVNLLVPMVSPNNPGSYTTTWIVKTNKNTLCKVSATIIVE